MNLFSSTMGSGAFSRSRPQIRRCVAQWLNWQSRLQYATRRLAQCKQTEQSNTPSRLHHSFAQKVWFWRRINTSQFRFRTMEYWNRSPFRNSEILGSSRPLKKTVWSEFRQWCKIHKPNSTKQSIDSPSVTISYKQSSRAFWNDWVRISGLFAMRLRNVGTEFSRDWVLSSPSQSGHGGQASRNAETSFVRRARSETAMIAVHDNCGADKSLDDAMWRYSISATSFEATKTIWCDFWFWFQFTSHRIFPLWGMHFNLHRCIIAFSYFFVTSSGAWASLRAGLLFVRRCHGGS